MIRAVAACLALVGVPAFPEGGPTAADRDLFIKAVTEHGCQLTNDEAEKIFLPLGMSREVIRAVADALVAEKLAYVAEGETMYVLTAGECAE